MILSGTTIGFISVIAVFLASVVIALLHRSLSRLALVLFGIAFLGGVVVTLLSGIKPREETSFQEADGETKALEERVKENPGDLKSHERLAHLYLQSQDYERVFQLSHEVLQIDPKSVESRVHMAMVLFSMREIDSSLAQFDQALKIDPNHPEALAFKGLVELQGQNNPKAAKKTWDRYLKLAKPGDVGYGMVQSLIGSL